jgi:uncharacterized membrane protein YcaP (DUF421 family)
MKSVRFRAVMCGRPGFIIENGKLNQAEMRRNRFTIDELMEDLRLNGTTDISAIKYAILETNGRLSILPYANQLPVKATQMNLTPEDVSLPLVIISDGKTDRTQPESPGTGSGLGKEASVRAWRCPAAGCLSFNGGRTKPGIYLP